MSTRPPLLALLATLCLLAAACKSGPPSLEGVPESRVREQLREWARGLSAEVQLASELVDSATEDRKTHEVTLHWRLRTTATAREIVGRDSTRGALFDAWSYSVQMLEYFRSGEGSELFGPSTAVAVEALQRVESDIARTVEGVLGTERAERAAEGVQRYAEAHPMRGLFVREPFAPRGRGRGRDAAESLQGLLELPLSLLQPLDETAGAMENFNAQAANFIATVNDMPDMLRWTTELLAYQLSDHQVVEQVGGATESVEALGLKLTAWDEDLERTWSALLTELDQHQEPLRSTLSEARGTAEELDQALTTAQAVVQEVDRTLGSLRSAGEAWATTAHAFGLGGEEEEPATPAEEGPSAAEQLESVRASTENLATTARDLRALLESGGLEEASASLREATVGAIDHLALRLAQLLALAALLTVASVLVVRLVRERRARRQTAVRGAA